MRATAFRLLRNGRRIGEDYREKELEEILHVEEDRRAEKGRVTANR